MTNAGCFATAIALGKYDVVHPRRIDLRPLHKRFQDDAAQVTCVERGERAAEFADGRANGGNNGSTAKLSHLAIPIIPESMRRAISPEDRPSEVLNISSLCSPLRGAAFASPRCNWGILPKAPAAG